MADIDIEAARIRLSEFASPTPLVQSLALSKELGCELWIKNETVSPVASFKWRGALNAILSRANGGAVVTSSTGNHGQGVAWAAARIGVPAHVFLPERANPTKREKIALLGATIHEGGHDLDAAKELAIAFADREAMSFIDDGESTGVIEGAGTIGAEIARALDEVDVVYVPMGSGSLAAGVALALKTVRRSVRVIAVQSAGSPAMVESFHARRAVERPAATVGDGLICRVPAAVALDLLLRHVDDAVLVFDEELLAATQAMILRAQILVEPSGAAGLAAVMRDRAALGGKRVVIIATGANITPELLRLVVDAGGPPAD